MTSYKKLTYEWMHKQIEELEKDYENKRKMALKLGEKYKIQLGI